MNTQNVKQTTTWHPAMNMCCVMLLQVLSLLFGQKILMVDSFPMPQHRGIPTFTPKEGLRGAGIIWKKFASSNVHFEHDGTGNNNNQVAYPSSKVLDTENGIIITNDDDNSLMSSKRLVEGAEKFWNIQKVVNNVNQNGGLNRRHFMGAVLIGTSATLAMTETFSVAAADSSWSSSSSSSSLASRNFGKLEWESTPVNKRTGVTVFDAEKAGYNVRFVTYLARFLLVFDVDCQKWWYSRAANIPRRATAEEVQEVRLEQFGAFSASVEVGLQEYEGPDGPAKLMEALLIRYCPDIETIREKRAKRGLAPLTEAEETKELREIKEARRQIALLFGLMEENQPVERLNRLLAAIDNGSIASVRIEDGGSGYAPGYGPPVVRFPPPKAGENFKTATGRAKLVPNGKILRIDLTNRGFGYQKAPQVIISAPGDDRGVDIPGSRPATGKALIFKNGVNKGRLERIQLEDSGEGYIEGEKIRVVITPPELPVSEGGVNAVATAIREYAVGSIEIVDGGTGYAIEKPIPVYVEPPPLTARINLNDPLAARFIDPNQPFPTATFPSAQMRKQMASSGDPKAFAEMVEMSAKNDGKGGGGGCIGRACYDRPVVAYGRAQAEASSFSTFRIETDALEPVEKEEEALQQARVVSATSSGSDSQLPLFWTGGPESSSAQLLTLLPAGLGLEYDTSLKRFVLSAAPDFVEINQGNSQRASNIPLDPEFGPRGRSPIERDLTLDLSSFLRFCASGAICASGAHLVLTPLDVIKTKIQTDPENYPGVAAAFQKVTKDSGLTGFFAGWVPTSIGFFCWGGFSYSVTELLRRYFNDMLGAQAASLEVPVILAAAAISSFFSVFILCPFEAVRIRSVAQPDFGNNILDITQRMIKEEGLGSLFSAVPPFIIKEVPFGVAKFLVFTVSTRLLLQTFPAAQEDIQLSLAVSLVGGMLGGLAAAIVSNPADATISEMKKAKTNMGPIATAKSLIERGGYANLMRGLPVRMTFYPLITSLQFFVYDVVRLYLGVGADDLKVYLDVLGGALKDGGSTVGPV